jgi:hypothetical protein
MPGKSEKLHRAAQCEKDSRVQVAESPQRDFNREIH